MKSCKEISALWGISERRVTQFCKDGKIPGAVRAGKQWQIPDDAKRPSDSRIVTGQYVKTETEEGKKPNGIFCEKCGADMREIIK